MTEFDQKDHTDENASGTADGTGDSADVGAPQPQGGTVIDPSKKSAKKMFSWREVAYVAQFVLAAAALSEAERQMLFTLCGSGSSDEDVVDLAQSLYPPTARIEAVTWASSLASKMGKGDLSFTDGIELMSDLTGSSEAELRETVRAVNYFSGSGESEQIKYRRNMPVAELLDGITSALRETDPAKLSDFDGVMKLLNIWPYGAM